MKRKTSLLLTITTLVLNLFTIQNLWAQKELELEEEERYVSIRHEQTDFYEDFGTETEEAYDSVNFNVLDYIKTNLAPHRSYKAEKCHLSKEIYGYHPYWFGASYYNQYDYNLLSTFIYFSYELDYNTGGYKSIHSWKTTNSINLAKKAGCKVELCVSNFGGYRNNKFLSNRKSWARLATNLIALLDYRDADGINLDFENVRNSDKDKLTNFVIYLHSRFEKERPGTSISMAVPGLNNYNTYDITAMNHYLSKVIIMAYDYHYSSSKHAGAVAPLDGYLSLKTTLNNY
ncbi:MAG: glycosyl hydrolase family 18 protein, partial [Chitinophagales bacterium]